MSKIPDQSKTPDHLVMDPCRQGCMSKTPYQSWTINHPVMSSYKKECVKSLTRWSARVQQSSTLILCKRLILCKKSLSLPSFRHEQDTRPAAEFFCYLLLGLARIVCIYTIYDRKFGKSLPKIPHVNLIYIWSWPTPPVMHPCKQERRARRQTVSPRQLSQGATQQGGQLTVHTVKICHHTLKPCASQSPSCC